MSDAWPTVKLELSGTVLAVHVGDVSKRSDRERLVVRVHLRLSAAARALDNTGQAQLPAYRAVAAPLRLAYSQFEELEIFARFSTRLDETTRHTLAHGRHVREILKQTQFSPLSVTDQIAALLAVTSGLLDHWPLPEMPHAEAAICQAVADELSAWGRAIAGGAQLNEEERQAFLAVARRAIGRVKALHDEGSVK